MWSFLSVLAACGTAVYLWREVRDAVYARVSALNVASSAASRLVSAQAAEFEIAQVARLAPKPKHEPIPVELMEYAQREAGGEVWAQEDIISEALERKEKLGSWDKVLASYNSRN